MTGNPNPVPEWVDGSKINEVLFCKAFLEVHPMICINGTFFTVEGRVTDENRLRREILEWIEPYVTSGLAKRVTGLLDTMRVKCYAPPLPVLPTESMWPTAPIFCPAPLSRKRSIA